MKCPTFVTRRLIPALLLLHLGVRVATGAVEVQVSHSGTYYNPSSQLVEYNDSDPLPEGSWQTGEFSASASVSHMGAGVTSSASASATTSTINLQVKTADEYSAGAKPLRANAAASVEVPSGYIPPGPGHGTVSATITIQSTIKHAEKPRGESTDIEVFIRGISGGFGRLGYYEHSPYGPDSLVRIDDAESNVDGPSAAHTFNFANIPFSSNDEPRELKLQIDAQASTYRRADEYSEATVKVTISGFSVTFIPDGEPDPTSDIVWTNSSGGSFDTESNWNPQQVPVKNLERADNAIFDVPASYTVQTGSPTTERLIVKKGNLTLDLDHFTAAAISQSEPSVAIGGGAILNLNGGTLESVHTEIGWLANGSQIAEIRATNSETAWANQGRLTIGGIGPGRLILTAAPSVTSSESRIGGGAPGDALVADGALWEAGDLAIGYGETGYLEVGQGGFVTADTIELGWAPDVHGELIVGGHDDPENPLDTNLGLLTANYLLVGNEGVGLVNIRKGGSIVVEGALIASRVFDPGIGGMGIFGTANGLSSSLTVNGALRIGGAGRPGELSIEEGGMATAGELVIGSYGDGSLSVSDLAGNEDTNLTSGSLLVGYLDSGRLQIGDYARVRTMTTAVIGESDPIPGVTSEVSVTGSQSVWQVGQVLSVGSHGTVEITDGAVVVGDTAPAAGWLRIGSGGTLSGTGTILCPGGASATEGGFDNFSGTVAPGASPGKLTIEGNYTQGADGVLEIEVGGLEGGFDHDVLTASGNISFAPGSKIRITFIDPNPQDDVTEIFIPHTGDTFEFISGSSISLPAGASFDDVVEFTNLPSGVDLAWETVLENGTTTVCARTTAAPTPPAGPRFVSHPKSRSPTAGESLTLSSATDGADSFSYQWYYDSEAIPGANQATYTLPSTQSFHAGSYYVVVMADGVSATSKSAAVSVLPSTASLGGLTNLSTRAVTRTGAGVLIPGFVVQGSANRSMLMRVIGPTLATFGVKGSLRDPQMKLKRFDGTTYIDVTSNDNWGNSSNMDLIATMASNLGSFSIDTASADAALFEELQPGQYTVVAESTDSDSGIVLVEFYDSDPSNSEAGLVNISARAFVGPGAESPIPGFVISERGPRTVLVRAIGPTLESFGVSGTLPDPQLFVYSGETRLFGNNDWEVDADGPATANVAERVGAFSLPTGSTDAALVVTLAPGAYTVVVSDVTGNSGIALVEVYLVP